MRIVDQSVSLEWITPDAALAIERAARTCYKSEDRIEPGTAEKLIRMLWERGHHSCLEHASASFRIVCDRGISHEIVRHRLASYSQESSRYCRYGSEKFGAEIAVILPHGLDDQEEWMWREAMKRAEESYMNLLNRHVRPEIARSVLPTCLKTELVMTANFREWLHFLMIRTAKASHPQMRKVAGLVGEILQKECPEVFDSSRLAAAGDMLVR